ncbi:MAG: hypothetical protein Q4B26_00220 [Eubacteriales bacterium]|nr:hypothetical protein [Eubacteriales bacterium]
MIGYTCVLPLNGRLDIEKFVRMVIEWNQTSPIKENRIDDLNWNGERYFHRGNSKLSFSIEIVDHLAAIRFEKLESDGTVTDTDFVANFEEQKLTIILDRSIGSPLAENNISYQSPHLVQMLLSRKYVAKDGDLFFTSKPFSMTKKNVKWMADVIMGKIRYAVPVVYVSRSKNNTLLVDAANLARRLRGIAHVVVQEDLDSEEELRVLSEGNNDYLGAVGIYFPNGTKRRYVFHKDEIEAEERSIWVSRKVLRTVITYMNAQKIHPLSTWQGVVAYTLSKRLARSRMELEHAKDKAENELQNYLDEFDHDNERLRKQVEDLTKRNLALSLEVNGLRQKLEDLNNVPLLLYGEEEEFFSGEIRDMVLSVLQAEADKLESGYRRKDILQDILDANERTGILEERQSELKDILKDPNRMTPRIKKKLQDLGFSISDDGKHYRLTYFSDERYKTTMSKTGSDWREGKNLFSEISNSMM